MLDKWANGGCDLRETRGFGWTVPAVRGEFNCRKKHFDRSGLLRPIFQLNPWFIVLLIEVA